MIARDGLCSNWLYIPCQYRVRRVNMYTGEPASRNARAPRRFTMHSTTRLPCNVAAAVQVSSRPFSEPAPELTRATVSRVHQRTTCPAHDSSHLCLVALHTVSGCRQPGHQRLDERARWRRRQPYHKDSVHRRCVVSQHPAVGPDHWHRQCVLQQRGLPAAIPHGMGRFPKCHRHPMAERQDVLAIIGHHQHVAGWYGRNLDVYRQRWPSH